VIYPIDKVNLDVLRFAHFLALAVVTLKFIPRDWPPLKSWWMWPPIVCGQHSLEIFCLGVFLSFAAHFAMVEVSPELWMQCLVSALGILIMIAAAGLLMWYKKVEGRTRIAPEEDTDADLAGRRGMRTPIAACFAVLSWWSPSWWPALICCRARHACEIPGYLLFGGNELNCVRAAVTKDHRLTIAGRDLPPSSPAWTARPPPTRRGSRRRFAKRLPSVAVKVVTLVRTWQTTGDLAQGMGKLLIDEKPDLVWQTGTVDAIRRVDPDNFRAALDEGCGDIE
jgi:hypothetical protein